MIYYLLFIIRWVYKRTFFGDIRLKSKSARKEGKNKKKNGVSRDRFELCDGISPERRIPGERLSSSSNFQASRLHPCRCFHHRQAPSGISNQLDLQISQTFLLITNFVV